MKNTLRIAVLLSAGVALPLAGCGDVRPATYGTTACTAWQGDVDKALAAGCSRCHGGTSPAAGYDVTTYNSALQDQSGTIVATAGDSSSLLLTKLDPATASDPHKNFGALRARLQSWVVSCQLNYSNFPIHPGGILNPASADFHGTWLRSLAAGDGGVASTSKPLVTDRCQQCHGVDLSGGSSRVACSKCHQGKLVDAAGKGLTGSDTCQFCHGQPPTSGAHLAHTRANNLVAASLDCTECHLKPTDYTDPGHFQLDDSGQVIRRATIAFGSAAGASYMYPGGPATPPTYDAASGRCSNVYCHGGRLPADSSAAQNAPQWRAGSSQQQCGSCHGLPPSTPNHQNAYGGQCSLCHPLVVDAQRNLTNKSLHIDGKVSLGKAGDGACNGCHGSGRYGAPPPDVLGNSDKGSVTVGAHAAHLNPPHKLRGPIPCGDCHLTPEQGKPEQHGHLDHQGMASVFPRDAAFTGLGTRDSAPALWDRGPGTCTNAYCHGGGALLAMDGSPGVRRSVQWLGPASQAQCGACHGVPPLGGSHTPDMRLQGCTVCHPTTIDSSGLIIVTGEASTHIDGNVDVKK
jgi:predicted CxxxxCH...CXXCH cytochrome family protein